MKWSIIIAFWIFGIACNKTNDSDNFHFRATMKSTSGKSVQANFLESETKFSKGTGTQGEEIVIAGLKKGGEYSLTLVIWNPKVGTYDLSNGPNWNGSNCNGAIPYPTNSYTTWGIGSGIITIESITDTTVQGHFNAVCIGIGDTLKITDGSFNGKIE